MCTYTHTQLSAIKNKTEQKRDSVSFQRTLCGQLMDTKLGMSMLWHLQSHSDSQSKLGIGVISRK